jgi:hypothetical protein
MAGARATGIARRRRHLAVGELKETPAHSVFDFPRADGSRRVIEYRTAWDPERDCFVCRWRELAVIDAA